MLSKINTLIIAVILSMLSATSVFAEQSFNVTIGSFTTTDDGLLLMPSSKGIYIGFIIRNEDNSWFITSDSMVQSPVGFVVTDKKKIMVNAISYSCTANMWTVLVGEEDEELKFKNDVTVIIPVGSVSVDDMTKELLIETTGTQDPSIISISYNKETKRWNILEEFLSF